MNTEVVRSQKPEERELDKKRTELIALEEELVQKELELTNLLAEMHVFNLRYLSIVGFRFAKLDEIEARIAEAYVSLNPADNQAAERVTEARNRAKESAKATNDIPTTLQKDKLQPSENLKNSTVTWLEKFTRTFVQMKWNAYNVRN